MKKMLCLFAALCLVAPLAFAKDAEPSDETVAPAPAPLSSVSIGTFGSYWNVSDLDGFDLSGAFGGGVFGQVRVHKYLALELRASFFEASNSEDITVQGQGEYETETTLGVIPLEAGLVGFWPLAKNFSLYGGPGVGYYFFDGESSSWQDPWSTTYDMDLDDDVGFYALLGGRVQLARNIALFFEGKYTWVETSPEREMLIPESIPSALFPPIERDIDFSGLAFNAGLLFTF